MTIKQFESKNEEVEAMTLYDWLKLRLTRLEYRMLVDTIFNGSKMKYAYIAMLLQEYDTCPQYNYDLHSGKELNILNNIF